MALALATLAAATSHAQRTVTMYLTLPERARSGPPPFFLSTEHNGWAPADTAYRFINENGRWVLRFAYDRPYYLQYRITRGSDASTESTVEGYGRPARLAEITRDTTIDVVVDGFADRIAIYRGGREGGPEWQATVERIGAALQRNPRNAVTVEIDSLGTHTPAAWRSPIARFLAERGARASRAR